MINRFIFFVFTMSLVSSTAYSQDQDKWNDANKKVIRLSPKEFTELPNNIALELENRGYTIPQTFVSTAPHNVIYGEFKKKGQTDWAILCSKDYDSSILVFWAGLEKNVTEIGKAPDKKYLEGIGDGKIGYSRVISPVGKRFILEHYKRYGGTKPPTITHQGINDSIGMASIVHYYYQGKWLKLTGAD